MWAYLIAQQGEQPLLREVFSFDYDDIIALTAALTALVAIFWGQRSRSKSEVKSANDTHTMNEEVNEGVLSKFTELFDRITKLEKELAETRIELRQALAEIAEMHKLEEFLQARLHEKDHEIAEMKKGHAADIKKERSEVNKLKAALEVARTRISKLESLCRSEGMDVDAFNITNGYN